jgi:hypothetical protein
MRGSFDSRKTYSMVPSFLAQYMQATRAHAVLVIVPKSQVVHPQLWENPTTKAAWDQFGSGDGFVCQVEAHDRKDRQFWFVDASTGERHELDEGKHGLMINAVFKGSTAGKNKGKGKKGRR